ncbi:MAG TPA: STAS domain-containing protein [Thermoanaerobaculia bacterium]|jgi:anti-sigma B factor antagonist|nr:STAS domain-containing protein [Thermoanaerobaculia bacterium]HEV8611377.1 STAS domain-containing protein [Thermoanaerobaculia bacterium]
MELKTEKLGNVTVITLSGKLITEASQDLKDGLYAHCESGPGHMLIDMKDVSYVSSYLIGVLVGCHKLLKKSGCDLHLSGLSPQLRMVLKVSGLTEIFPNHETREEGLEYFDTTTTA